MMRLRVKFARNSRYQPPGQRADAAKQPGDFPVEKPLPKRSKRCATLHLSKNYSRFLFARYDPKLAEALATPAQRLSGREIILALRPALPGLRFFGRQFHVPGKTHKGERANDPTARVKLPPSQTVAGRS